MIVIMREYCDSFAENKDIARDIRNSCIFKSYEDTNDIIILDFKDVDASTQSFVHALISELFQTYGESVLNRIEFKNCNKAIRSIISTVVNYSLE